jgi:hypothetical protein
MVTKFVIDRERWLRGDRPDLGMSMLRDEHGRMCCLGFYAEACGVAPEAIEQVADPAGIGGDGQADIPTEMQWLVRRYAEDWRVTSAECNDITFTNDYGNVLDREKALTAFFAAQGIEIEFVN